MAPRNSPLRETHFDNARLAGLGIEWMSLSELRRRVAPGRMVVPERLDFYMLLLITEGTGTHTVDFVQSPLAPGSVVFVRPGQVQQWGPGDRLEGSLLLATATTLLPADRLSNDLLAIDEWPAIAVLPEALMPEIMQAVDRARQDFERFDQRALDMALIRHGLHGLLLRLARWLTARPDQGPIWAINRAVYRLFLRELEARFQLRLGVKDYAARLGYSPSTLSRACMAAEGRSAKQVIDRRVALEAARQLVHSEASVSEIGHQLGFSEATNFVKFFGRMVGCPPHAFRLNLASSENPPIRS